MANKTAMQLLIEKLLRMPERQIKLYLLSAGEMYLEKEKEQIMDAYEYGCFNGDLDGSEQWYNQTYLKEEQK